MFNDRRAVFADCSGLVHFLHTVPQLKWGSQNVARPQICNLLEVRQAGSESGTPSLDSLLKLALAVPDSETEPGAVPTLSLTLGQKEAILTSHHLLLVYY